MHENDYSKLAQWAWHGWRSLDLNTEGSERIQTRNQIALRRWFGWET